MERIGKLLREGNARALRELSKELIYKAVETYDKELASKAVIAYALSKLLSKVHIVNSPQWEKYRSLILDAIERGAGADRIVGIIASVDDEMGNYVHSIVDKAKVKMASHAYAAGLSLRAAAELTGADINELIDYVGKTTIHDEEDVTISMRDRVNALRRLLG